MRAARSKKSFYFFAELRYVLQPDFFLTDMSEARQRSQRGLQRCGTSVRGYVGLSAISNVEHTGHCLLSMIILDVRTSSRYNLWWTVTKIAVLCYYCRHTTCRYNHSSNSSPWPPYHCGFRPNPSIERVQRRPRSHLDVGSLWFPSGHRPKLSVVEGNPMLRFRRR